LGRSRKDQLSLRGICDVTDTHHTLCMLLGWQRISSRFYGSKGLREKIFMRAVSKRNFSHAKYGKFIWPQGKGVDL
jgi:hypothetical protein